MFALLLRRLVARSFVSTNHAYSADAALAIVKAAKDATLRLALSISCAFPIHSTKSHDSLTATTIQLYLGVSKHRGG